MENQDHIAAIRKKLLELSHELGKPENRLAILGEGNTSAAIDKETFIIKASGSELRTLKPEQAVQIRFDKILPVMEQRLDQQQTHEALMASRVDSQGMKPSVETTFHAWLLRQEGVKFVGHCHPIEVNKIMCSEKAEEFVNYRTCPDEIVCCGPRFLLIDYVDPGTELAGAIRDGWQQFLGEYGFPPRVICLKNHGLITVGSTPESVLASTFMAVKAAEIFNGAYALGKAVFMPDKEVWHIHNRLDEHYRQKRLKLS